MKSRSIKLLGLVFVVTLSGNPVPPAYANLNISGDACSVFNGIGEQYISGTAGSKENIGSSSPVTLVCNMPRSPLAATATTGIFFVDGEAGSGTTCTIYSFDFTGVFLGSSSFVATPFSTYDGAIVMGASELPYWGYTSLMCQLSAGAHFRGVTVVQ